METAIILGAIVQIVTLIVFFVMAANLSNLKKIAKTQLDRMLFSSSDYLKMMEEINAISVPEHREGYSDANWVAVMFGEDDERFSIVKEVGHYSCFFGEKEVFFPHQRRCDQGVVLT